MILPVQVQRFILPTTLVQGYRCIYVAGVLQVGTGNLGGNLYLYGGSGVQGGNPGNVSICYNGSGSSNTGWLGVGCAAANGYQLKVCGNVLITGTLTVQGTGGPGIAPGGGPALTMVLGIEQSRRDVYRDTWQHDEPAYQYSTFDKGDRAL